MFINVAQLYLTYLTGVVTEVGVPYNDKSALLLTGAILFHYF